MKCTMCAKEYKSKTSLKNYLKKVHDINKTFDPNKRTIPNSTYPSTILTMNQKDISNSRTFKYLGTKISYDQPIAGDDEVNHRKLQANIAFNKHRKVLKNYRILLPTRVQLLDSLVRSKLTYNCQTWPFTEKQTNTMNAQYVRYLRELVRNGTARKGNSYSLKMTNKQILHIAKRENLSVFMSRIQEKFIATIIRAPNICQNKKTDL